MTVNSDKQSETIRLKSVADTSKYLQPVNALMIQYCGKIFSRFINGGDLLELGPAEGVMTENLIGLADSVTLVEGAEPFCKLLKQKFPNVEVVNQLFEEYRPDKKFDRIVLGHVLEHVNDPLEILALVKDWLKNDGRILAAVPNARSLHRQAAVNMGLLNEEDEMSEMDIHHGHRRIFNPESFRNIFRKAGLEIEVFGGYWLKPISNKQLEEGWTERMLNAFMELGERYPDIAAEIYVVAKIAL